MAQRKAFLHIGLPHPGTGWLGEALLTHAEALRDSRLSLPARSTQEMFRASLEIRRAHRSAGYRRADVEGAWAGVCRRAHKSTGNVILSQEHLVGADRDQIALLLDGLSGFEVNVVIAARNPAAPGVGRAGEDLGLVLERWTAATHHDRVHVIATPGAPDTPAAVWAAFGRIVGLDADALPLPARVVSLVLAEQVLAEQVVADGEATPRPGDVSAEARLHTTSRALADLLAEVARLREHNRSLEARTTRLERKRTKLKQKLARPR